MHKPSDYPSTLLYILDQTHVTVTAATAIAILWSQSAHCLWFGAGAVSSTLIARGIKRAIRQPRPPPPPPESSRPSPVRPKKTYGMPSTHCSALGFYLAYMAPLLPLSSGLVWPERLAVGAIAAMTIWSRVALGYHTVPQVAAGTGLGFVWAAVWSGLWKAYPVIGDEIQAIIDVVRSSV